LIDWQIPKNAEDAVVQNNIFFYCIEMFENFKIFFANKKNLSIFIAALVILGGIMILKKYDLYEGLENAETNADAKATPTKQTSTIIKTQIP
jgi:hypothetical protein